MYIPPLLIIVGVFGPFYIGITIGMLVVVFFNAFHREEE